MSEITGDVEGLLTQSRLFLAKKKALQRRAFENWGREPSELSS